MSIALYRKYRPKTFSEVTNQNHIKVTLQNEIETDRLGHAYLFCGPRGTGKTTLARLLAKAVNCEQQETAGEPCNKCPSCEEIMAGRALDIIEIDAASHTGVDNVRENIINNARFTPTKNKYKVFIIDEVHMLSTQAFNALLKTLEEPPAYVIFILATTEAHKVPTTIISRCQRFDFKKINFAELVSRLKWIIQQEGVTVDEQVLGLIAKNANGCVRDAESLLEQVLSLGDKNISAEQAELILPKDDFNSLFDLFEMIVLKKRSEAIALINKLVEDGIDIGQFSDNLVEFVRRVLLTKISDDITELSRELDDALVKKIMALLPQIGDQALVRIIEKTLETKKQFQQNYLPQLGLEVAILELTQGIEQKNFIPNPQNVEARQGASRENDVPNNDEAKPKIIKKPELRPPSSEKPTVETQNLASREEDGGQNLASREEGASIENSSQSDLESLLRTWPQILQKMKADNYSLFISLQMSKPIALVGGEITLGFLFELQKSRVDDIKSKRLVEEIIESLLGERLAVKTVIEPALGLADVSNTNHQAQPSMPIENSVDDIANEFGGQIVEN